MAFFQRLLTLEQLALDFLLLHSKAKLPMTHPPVVILQAGAPTGLQPLHLLHVALAFRQVTTWASQVHREREREKKINAV